MRRAALKTYIFAMLGEGQFRGLKSPAEIAAKAAALFAQDVQSVLAEVANLVLAEGMRRAGNVVAEKMAGLADELGHRGIGGIWEHIQSTYARGAEVTGRGKK